MGTKPGERVMGQLERRVEAISGEFNSQEVANTLWAFATMGLRPGGQLIGKLGRRTEAISGEFSSQEVANTLWAFATMGRKSEEGICTRRTVTGMRAGLWWVASRLVSWQGHVPEVQGVLGASHVHVFKESCASVFGRSLHVPGVQCVHSPNTTVMTVLLNV